MLNVEQGMSKAEIRTLSRREDEEGKSRGRKMGGRKMGGRKMGGRKMKKGR